MEKSEFYKKVLEGLDRPYQRVEGDFKELRGCAQLWGKANGWGNFLIEEIGIVIKEIDEEFKATEASDFERRIRASMPTLKKLGLDSIMEMWD